MAERLGPYRLVRRLGTGGMAEVWEAWRDGASTPVALKTLPLDEEVNGAARQRLLDEGALSQRLDHPNVVRVHEVGVDGTRVFIAMERLDGVPISRLGPEPAPAIQVARLAVQVLRGLAHAHAAPFEIVHRDLKPSNLFVTRDGVVKVIDFGIASAPLLLARTLTATGVFRGTLSYAAPEQLRAEPSDARTDLFALALVLRELVTGHKVFDGGSQAEIVGQVLFTPVAPLQALVPEVPLALAQALDWGLEKDRAARPPSAAAWADRLASALSTLEAEPFERWVTRTLARLAPSGPETVSGVEVLPPAPPPPRKPKRWPIAAVLAFAVLGGAWIATRAPEPEPPAPTLPPPPAPVVVAEPPPPSPPEEPPSPKPPPKKPRPTIAATGLVTVQVKPTWARVLVDGKDLGPSPVFRHKVNVGRVLVEGVRPDGTRRKRFAEVRRDQESIVILEW